MDLLGLYFSSVIISNYMDFINYGRIYKDMADRGNIILSIHMYESYSKEINKETDFNFINYFIPFYNIGYALKNTKEYNRNINDIFNYLSTIGVLKEMSNEEKIKYNKKPTIINAFIISTIHEINEKQKEIEFDFLLKEKIINTINDLNNQISSLDINDIERYEELVSLRDELVFQYEEKYGNSKKLKYKGKK